MPMCKTLGRELFFESNLGNTINQSNIVLLDPVELEPEKEKHIRKVLDSVNEEMGYTRGFYEEDVIYRAAARLTGLSDKIEDKEKVLSRIIDDSELYSRYCENYFAVETVGIKPMGGLSYAQRRPIVGLLPPVKREISGKGKLLALGLVGLAIGAGAVAAYYYFTKDSDGDGIPDWKDPHKYIHEDEFSDDDKDGLINWDEKNVYHTDPNNIDTDNDYVRDDLEVELGTNPLKIDTDDGGVDDFNELYTYGMDPKNPTDDIEFMKKIPNVVARHWDLGDGKVGGYTEDKYVEISMKDPLIQWYAEQAEIMWETTPEGKKIGTFYVDGDPIWKGVPEPHERSIDQPSYYFTHGRKGVCSTSSLANFSILKLMGYKTIYMGGRTSRETGHAWLESYIDEEVYVVNFNKVKPREGYYEESGLTITSPKNYSPDWYK